MLGTILGDRYKIKSEIGHGGMAAVFLGFDQVLKREVEIKILHAHLARDSELCHRFQQEASLRQDSSTPILSRSMTMARTTMAEAIS